MFFAISDFTTGNRAALFAARVAVGAAVRSGDGVIWGVSDPLCHPPDPVPGLLGGGRSRPNACRYRPAEPRPVAAIAECAACVGRGVKVIRVDWERVCQVLPENCVHIGERALALNLNPRRHRAVISCLSPNLRVSFVLFVLSLSIAVARPSRREIVRRSSAQSSHFASLRPLRAGGLDSASAAPAIGQLRDGHRSIANVLSA